MTDITGQWTGTVVYGQGYGQFKGKELFFEFDLIQHVYEIAGSGIDTGGSGISPDSADILGTFKDNKINFIKRYKSSHFYQDGEIKIDRAKLGPKIKYTGIYNEQDGTFSGEWVIRLTVFILWFIPIPIKNAGTWTMKRK